ncbi:hypothetical protein [Pontibacter sp. SGAir0037]|uniref:hypothetical protein n=1 Tax=Pontibacter sp. SGAir0037 TaxID=2571030 RepID=UPI0010CD0DA5|nr:hypothetical protein [Pontibacter sp. SGAir0037]QCR24750.1 hypothetical protein C1N53_21930 [Pontibacter sp. SGAir0037]
MQLELFPEPSKDKQKRKDFTTADIKLTRELYTNGKLPGKEMAKLLGHSYDSFRLFVQRNPELKKGR